MLSRHKPPPTDAFAIHKSVHFALNIFRGLKTFLNSYIFVQSFAHLEKYYILRLITFRGS